jgi:hypothetical protein
MREQDIDAIQKSEKLSRRVTAKPYTLCNAPEPTLRGKTSDATPMAEIRPTTQILEETAVV